MEQLKEVLREVLKEELAPITSRLDGLETRFDGLETRFDGLETRFEKQISSIKEQLDRMERSQTEDIVAMLQLIDKKITTRTDRHEHQINVLNERLLAVEADVHKILSSNERS